MQRSKFDTKIIIAEKWWQKVIGIRSLATADDLEQGTGKLWFHLPVAMPPQTAETQSSLNIPSSDISPSSTG